MHYLYVLKSTVDNNLYVGQTSDLRRRFLEHNSGKNVSTKHRAPFILVYYEAYADKRDVCTRELRLKKFGKAYEELKKRIEKSLNE